MAALKSFFHYLHDEGIIDADPTVALESPKVKKHLPKAISVDDVELLLAEPTKSNSPKSLATARCWRCCTPPACA